MFSRLHEGTALPTLPDLPLGATIPKLIHQVYASKNLPPIIQKNIQKITALNPGWEYRFYDDQDIVEFIKEFYGLRVLAYYHRINPRYGAARADLFRYLLLYKSGGVYLDIKSSVDRSLDGVLMPDDTYLLARWRNDRGNQYQGWGRHRQLRHWGGDELQQWHIIATQGHPFLRAVIERVLHNIDCYNPIMHNTGRPGVIRVTGPLAYTLAIAPLLDVYPHRVVDSERDIGLSYSIFDQDNRGAHKSIFNFHYSELTEPVINPTGTSKILWLTVGPFANYLVNLALRIVAGLARRIPNGPRWLSYHR